MKPARGVWSILALCQARFAENLAAAAPRAFAEGAAVAARKRSIEAWVTNAARFRCFYLDGAAQVAGAAAVAAAAVGAAEAEATPAGAAPSTP